MLQTPDNSEKTTTEELSSNELTPMEFNHLVFYALVLRQERPHRVGTKDGIKEISTELDTNPITRTKLTQIISLIDKAINRLGEKEEKDTRRALKYDVEKYRNVIIKINGLDGNPPMRITEFSKEVNMSPDGISGLHSNAIQKLIVDPELSLYLDNHPFYQQ